MNKSHRVVKKSFETEMLVDGHELPLNHFVQETIANIMVGFSKTLKGLEAPPEKIEIKINPQVLLEKRLIHKIEGRIPKVKILGKGILTKAIVVEDCDISKQAKEKIEKADGKVKK